MSKVLQELDITSERADDLYRAYVDLTARAVELRRAGASYREIADDLGLNIDQARQILARYEWGARFMHRREGR